MAQKNDYLSRIKNNKLQHQNYETEASEINTGRLFSTKTARIRL